VGGFVSDSLHCILSIVLSLDSSEWELLVYVLNQRSAIDIVNSVEDELETINFMSGQEIE